MSHTSLPTYEVIELDVEHIVLSPTLEDIIARIEHNAQRIAAFTTYVQGY